MAKGVSTVGKNNNSAPRITPNCKHEPSGPSHSSNMSKMSSPRVTHRKGR